MSQRRILLEIGGYLFGILLREIDPSREKAPIEGKGADQGEEELHVNLTVDPVEVFLSHHLFNLGEIDAESLFDPFHLEGWHGLGRLRLEQSERQFVADS